MAKALVWEREVGLYDGFILIPDILQAKSAWNELMSALNVVTRPVPSEMTQQFVYGQVAFIAEFPDENDPFFYQALGSFPINTLFLYTMVGEPVVQPPPPPPPPPLIPGGTGDGTTDTGTGNGSGTGTGTGNGTTDGGTVTPAPIISMSKGMIGAAAVALLAVSIGLAWWFGRRQKA